MRGVDPDFNGKSFGRESREHVVPKVDAHLSVDQETLKAWRGKTVNRLADIAGMSQD